MDRDKLKARIEKIRGFNDILNFVEAQAKRTIIEPICDSLGWDTSDPDEVRLEYSTSSGGRVDYALLNNKKPIILLEAKKPAESLDNHGKQVLRYAFDIGAPLAVLTNGIQWWLYLPHGEGRWEDRKFYSIDIHAQEIDSICDRFIEFLGKDNVISGSAVNNAKKKRIQREGKQKIEATLPEVWEEIINEPNELLVDLLIEETERKCGFKPSEQQAKGFISKITRPVEPLPVKTISRIPRQTVRHPNRTNQPIKQKDLPEIIIKVLQENGGRATKAFVDDKIYKMFEKLFQEEYYQHSVAQGIPRWKHNIAWAKENAKKLGYIKPPSESGRGYWELSELGKEWAKKL